jgi:hypothetical protein
MTQRFDYSSNAIFVPQEEQKGRCAKFFVPQWVQFLKSAMPQCRQ